MNPKELAERLNIDASWLEMKAGRDEMTSNADANIAKRIRQASGLLETLEVEEALRERGDKPFRTYRRYKTPWVVDQKEQP